MRWREKRNELAQDLNGTPDDISAAILFRLGAEKAKKVARALDKRLRNIKPDCPHCKGTGLVPWYSTTACGMVIGGGRVQCNCGPNAFVDGMRAEVRRGLRRRRRPAPRKGE
jgi:hypothetical protein